MQRKNYAVENHIAGYMPDNYDDGYPSRRAAERGAAEKARQWREDGWIVRGNAKDGYIAYQDKEAMESAYSLPTYIQVLELDEPYDENACW